MNIIWLWSYQMSALKRVTQKNNWTRLAKWKNKRETTILMEVVNLKNMKHQGQEVEVIIKVWNYTFNSFSTQIGEIASDKWIREKNSKCLEFRL